MESCSGPALPQQLVIYSSPLKKAISDIRDEFKHDKAREGVEEGRERLLFHWSGQPPALNHGRQRSAPTQLLLKVPFQSSDRCAELIFKHSLVHEEPADHCGNRCYR